MALTKLCTVTIPGYPSITPVGSWPDPNELKLIEFGDYTSASSNPYLNIPAGLPSNGLSAVSLFYDKTGSTLISVQLGIFHKFTVEPQRTIRINGTTYVIEQGVGDAAARGLTDVPWGNSIPFTSTAAFCTYVAAFEPGAIGDANPSTYLLMPFNSEDNAIRHTFTQPIVVEVFSGFPVSDFWTGFVNSYETEP